MSLEWRGMGFECNPNLIRYVISWGLLAIGYVGMPKEENSKLSFFFQIQWFFTVMPMLTLYVFNSDKTSSLYMTYVFVVIVVQNIVVQRVKNVLPVKLNSKIDVRGYFSIGLIIITIFCIVVINLWNNFEGLKAFDFSYIYTMREKLEFPNGFAYLIAWVTRVIIPFLYMKYMVEKKFGMAVALFAMQVFLYMILGYKYLLLLMVLYTAIFLICKLKIPIKAVALGANFLVFLGIYSYQIEKIGTNNLSIKINALLGDRFLFIPALNKFQYYGFFSEHPKVWFANGTIGKCLGETNLYKYSMGYTICGWFRNGKLEADFNTGYLGDAYAQVGFVGMLLMGVILAIIVIFINSYSKYISDVILYGFIGYVAYSMNDGALLTACITGGIWLIILICMIYARKENNYD